jgi:hypothetical protein
MNTATSLQMVISGSNERVALEAMQAVQLKRGELAKLKGPAIFLDRVSANNRKYNSDSVHAQVKALQPRIQAKSLYGELDHPPINDLNRLAYVQMTQVSHRIDALYYDQTRNCYMIEVTILDTPNGRILKAMLDSGSPLYVSLRSLLDPAKNKQMNGYIDAWMMLLITVDFVSTPGFSDAVLEPIAVANESMIAVCECYQVKSILQSNNVKRMQKQFKIVNAAFESLVGAQISEPTKELKEFAADMFVELKNKLAEKFSDEEFNKTFEGLYKGNQLGLYADAATVACTDFASNSVISFKLERTDDGEFRLPSAPEFVYNLYESDTNPEPAQLAPGIAAEEMFVIVNKPAVAGNENFVPSEAFIAVCNDVLDYMHQNYDIGFDINAFGDIANSLNELYGVTASIDQSGETPVLVISKDNAIARYSLNVEGNSAVVDSIYEYAAAECDAKPANENADAAPKPANDKLIDEKAAPEGAQEPAKAITDDTDKQRNQDALKEGMYAIVDDQQNAVKTGAVVHPKSDKQEQIAEECARVFGMPDSKYAGVYAIEHIPAAFKHLWQGSSEAAKAVILLKAKEAQIATEAQAIRFWSKIDFVALEQALIRKAAQPAVEHKQAGSTDWRLNLLNAGYNKRIVN